MSFGPSGLRGRLALQRARERRNLSAEEVSALKVRLSNRRRKRLERSRKADAEQRRLVLYEAMRQTTPGSRIFRLSDGSPVKIFRRVAADLDSPDIPRTLERFEEELHRRFVEDEIRKSPSGALPLFHLGERYAYRFFRNPAEYRRRKAYLLSLDRWQFYALRDPDQRVRRRPPRED